jgi:hypothetical protein
MIDSNNGPGKVNLIAIALHTKAVVRRHLIPM